MPKTHGKRSDGTPITGQVVETLADEAEDGISVSAVIREALRKYVKAS